tara:strand:- start:620 stop:1318 length:699 start_codon:yes stop_codon:yes gene_type:complete
MEFNINKISKAFDERLILFFYKQENYFYEFYILGNSNYIYNVSIGKDYQECNCENFLEGTYCKHICFVLFKVIRIFNYNKKKKLILRLQNNKLINTNFFTKKIFDYEEWIDWKLRFNRIRFLLKKSFFDEKEYFNFQKILNNCNMLFKKKIIYENGHNCLICLNNKSKFIKCNICNNEYHINCLLKWYNIQNYHNCPICKSDYLGSYLIYMILISNRKLSYDIYEKANIYLI